MRRVRPEARIVATLHDYHPICANEGLMTTTAAARSAARRAERCLPCLFPRIAPRASPRASCTCARLLGRVDRFIAPSRFLRERFVAWGLPASAIDVIPNAVPARAPRPAGPARPRDRFAFFGNLAPHKGVLSALSAIGASRRRPARASRCTAIHRLP